jgi:hypothetical protein
VGAVADGGWDVPRCTAHRLAEDSHCAAGCASRLACVYGRDQLYPADALVHHQRAARRVMADHASAARKV